MFWWKRDHGVRWASDVGRKTRCMRVVYVYKVYNIWLHYTTVVNRCPRSRFTPKRFLRPNGFVVSPAHCARTGAPSARTRFNVCSYQTRQGLLRNHGHITNNVTYSTLRCLAACSYKRAWKDFTYTSSFLLPAARYKSNMPVGIKVRSPIHN
jgi:hypothetical protein